MGRADRSNPEDRLVIEAQDVAEGRKPRTQEWRVEANYGENWRNGAGSGNWGIEGLSIRYSQEPESIRAYLLTVALPLLRQQFMLTEIMTLIYGEMWLDGFLRIAKFARKFGDAELLAGANELLRTLLTIAAARQAPDGRVIVAGARSGSGGAERFGQPWYRWALGLARDDARETAAGMAGLKAAGKGPDKSWKKVCILSAEQELRAACPRFPWALPLGITGAVGLVVLGCESGVATYLTESVNSNTSPRLASIWRGPGEIWAAPGDNSIFHSRAVRANLSDDGTDLIWTIEGRSGREPLPGKVNWRLVLPKFGGQTSPADPPPATPPPGIDIEALVAEVRALGAQEADTDRAVAKAMDRMWLAASLAVSMLAVPRRNQGAKVALSDRLAKLAEGGR